MRNSFIKRSLALLLSIVLLMGSVPVAVFATDEELPAATETVVPEETSAPTVAPTEPPAVETEAPTEAPAPATESQPEFVEVEFVVISQKNGIAELTVGEKVQLTAEVLPENATDKVVLWTSSEESVATVDVDGEVSAISAGSVTIFAICGAVEGTYKLTVKAVSSATELEISEESIEMICTGLVDCTAEKHTDDCAKKLADDKEIEDKIAVDEVVALIEALPALEAVYGMSLEEQKQVYTQVQSAYTAYEKLTDDQKALLHPAEEVFNPYFDYFNSLTQETAIASGKCGTYATWSLDSNGTLTITGRGKISSNWSAYENSITSVTMSDSITAIGAYAFMNCIALTSVDLSQNLLSIEDSAFHDCESLTDIKIPSSVNNIGTMAFYNCSRLKVITIPNGIRSVPEYAFAYCKSLSEIIIPDSVTIIGGRAFLGCANLKSVTIGRGVANIGDYAFQKCEKLTDVYIKDPSAWCNISFGTEPLLETYANPMRHADNLHVIDDEGNEVTHIVLDSTVTEFSWDLDDCKITSIVIPETLVKTNWLFRSTEDSWHVLYTGTEKQWRELKPSYNDWTPIVHTNARGDEIVEGSKIWCYGREMYKCTICGDAYIEYFDEPKHNFGEWMLLYDAECTDYGAYYSICQGEGCEEIDIKLIDPYGHDEVYEEGYPATCTEDGLTEHTYCTRCEKTYVPQTVIPALGHTVVVQEGFEASCTEDGLTEGSYCSVCEEVLEVQEVIPATGHAFEVQNGAIVCPNCGMEMYVRIAQDYLAMDLQVLTEAQLAYELSHEDLEDRVTWSIEGDEGIVEIDENGFVTAVGEGAVHAVATLTYQVSEDSKLEVSARCRIDVTAEPQIEGVQLSATTCTTELYSGNYTTFEILLQLPQNYTETEPVNTLARPAMMAVAGENMGVAIEKAVFVNEQGESLEELFELRLLDDRTVQIVPKIDEEITNPAEVKAAYAHVLSKYKGKVVVTVQDKDYESELVTLNVKKTLPKLKATVPAFNSFYMGQSRNIVITGATATEIYADESKNTATKSAMPAWVEFGEELGQLTLKADAPLKSVSGSAYLAVKTEEYRVPVAVTLSVKNTFKAPGLKLSATTVTASAKNSGGISLKLLSTDKKKTLEDVNVKGITAPAGYSIEDFNVADGSFRLVAENGFAAGKITLKITFSDTKTERTLNLTIETVQSAVKLGSSTMTLNTYGDTGVVEVKVTPADYLIDSLCMRLVNSKGEDKTYSDELDIYLSGNYFVIFPTESTPLKENYKMYISTADSKESVLSIKVVDGNPSVSCKLANSLDLTFPEKAATITTTYKNCNGYIDSFDYYIEELRGSTVINSDVAKLFSVQQVGKNFEIRCIDESAVNTSSTYQVTMKIKLLDGTELPLSKFTMKLKRTSVSLKLSPTKLTLNKTVGDVGTVNVTCGTKGYTVTDPIIQVMDSTGKVSAEGKLKVTYENGKLIVNQTEETAYGATYKVLVRANSYAPAVTLTVTVPTREKSNITATLNTKGSIDVIRDGSALTVTPVYKNVIDGKRLEEKLIFTKTVKTVTEDATDLFFYTENADGSLTVTKRDGAELDHSAKYSVQLVAYNGEEKVCETKPKAITVKMGTAKLTVASQSATLFAKDRNDRVVFWFDTTDTALNGIAEVKIKEAANDKLFEIIPYGDGIYAIAFKDEKVDSSFLTQKSASKAVTVTLNVTLDGNETAKVNAALKLKLTVVK